MNVKFNLNKDEDFVLKSIRKGDSPFWIDTQISQQLVYFSVFEGREKYSLIYPAPAYGEIDVSVYYDVRDKRIPNPINLLKVFNDDSEKYYIVEDFDFIFNTSRCPICGEEIVDSCEHRLVHEILSGKKEPDTILPNKLSHCERVMKIPDSVNRSGITSYTILTGSDGVEIELNEDLIEELYKATGVDITYYKYISVFAYDAFIHYHGPIKLPTSKYTKVWEFFEKAFIGGYTQINQFCVDADKSVNIFDIDAKSMYPSCMQLYKYPDWKHVEIITKNFDEIWNAPIDGEYGYLVDFEASYIPDCVDDLPLTISRSNGKLEASLIPSRVCDLWMSMKFMKEMGYSIEIYRAVKYSQSYVFGDFMQNMFTVRLNHPELSNIIKRMMNSLYGCFLQTQKYSVRNTPALDPLRNVYSGNELRVLNTKSILQHPSYLSNVCLMWSKYKLRTFFYTLKSNLKNVRLIATFTDSIVFSTESPKSDVDRYVSNQSKLGEWCYKSDETIEKYICLSTKCHMALTESSTDDDINKMNEMIDEIERRYKKGTLYTAREVYVNEAGDIVTRAKRMK